jgi:hypothetical protein
VDTKSLCGGFFIDSKDRSSARCLYSPPRRRQSVRTVLHPRIRPTPPPGSSLAPAPMLLRHGESPSEHMLDCRRLLQITLCADSQMFWNHSTSSPSNSMIQCWPLAEPTQSGLQGYTREKSVWAALIRSSTTRFGNCISSSSGSAYPCISRSQRAPFLCNVWWCAGMIFMPRLDHAS